MPLRSKLLSGNKALQACLVSDSAHVAPGASGKPVVLIQSALVRLSFLEPGDGQAEAGHYGPRTAAAVLAFKNTFKIINRSYQTHADNIVGRMTIAALDDAIFVLDGGTGGPRVAPAQKVHPQSPGAAAAPRTVPVGAPSKPVLRLGFSVAAPSGNTQDGLSALPVDVREAVLRSNAAKKPGQLMLFPFTAAHEGPLPTDELAARFGSENADSTGHMLAVHTRMKPFDIWKNIRVIVNVYQGTGSRGLFFHPFDHDSLFRQMTALTTGPVTQLDPNVVPLSVPLTDSKFCRDMFGVHGPRDSFREIVKQGPGLHICITQPAARPNTACDAHIDEIQQGQVCSRGMCIPIINGQTIEHLETVGPWLAKEGLKALKKLLP
jgi:peptidoglycan hydrolase-like protein with peptidoglycan-binding domain